MVNDSSGFYVKESGKFSLPAGPSDLCFDPHEFLESSFSVDSFLLEHKKKTNLETIRDDLGIYLKVLRSAMIELINKDYADFVNLSSNLIGLDKAIHSIQVPLGQLKEEVMQVKQALDDSMSQVSEQLEQRRTIHFKKRTLNCTATVQNVLPKLKKLLSSAEVPLSPDIIERTASEYNQLQFALANCVSFNTDEIVKDTENICKILTSSLNSKFLESVRSNNMAEMAHCLRVYVMLDQISCAEELFRKEIISAALADVLCDHFLNANGLQGVYSFILNFIEKEMKIILEVTSEKSSQVRRFDFLVNSLWTEVERRLEVNMSMIYAPGNPETFYKRYCESMEFLDQLDEHCYSPEHLEYLHCHPQYKAFLERWNLPVYFQIRFQEIAGSFETTASDSKSINVLDSTSEFQVLITSVLWDCLMQCWSEGIFLTKLGHRFWKLSLQLLARYSVWLQEFLQKEHPSISSSSDLKSTSQKDVQESEDRAQLLLLLYLDSQKLTSKIPLLEEKTLQKLCGLSEQNKTLVKKSFENSKQQILDNLPAISQAIVNRICDESLVHLRQVNDIPRLFRRTNRETPTKPCAYVAQVLMPSESFVKKHEGKVEKQLLHQWLFNSLSTLTEHYWNSVNDVLTSVQKTEESLRRLKKLREKTSVSSMETRGSDDDKIRRQLVIDVENYCSGVLAIGFKKKDINKLEELIMLVNQASQVVMDTK